MQISRRPWLLGTAATAAALASCSIYGSDLLGSGGSGSGGSSTSAGSSASTSGSSSGSGGSAGSSTASSSSGGSGGMAQCTQASECPGVDTECRKRTCMAGTCGATSTAMGTALAAQTPGDCKQDVCDGNGGVSSVDDNSDKLDDLNDCTTDGCAAGAPTHVFKAMGAACATGGGKVCTAAGKCVGCIVAGDCQSMVCQTATNTCVGALCNDTVKNGTETDVDCGGGNGCPDCGHDKTCIANSDCLSQSCVSGKCAATCTDTEKDGNETDVDCGGGGACPLCASGKTCGAGGDCQSGKCSGGKCADVLLISELQTRGSAGASDEFIEIYNPTAIAVKFDTTWEVWARNAASSACATLNKRITGAGQTIPAHGHLLLANSAGYNAAVTSDATYTTGFTDSGQVVLLHGGALVDSLCYHFNAATQANLTCATPPAMWFVCQGTPVSNLPHNDGTSAASSTDVSLERKPGGAAGNGQSTGDNGADWNSMVSPNPQNLASPTTP